MSAADLFEKRGAGRLHPALYRLVFAAFRACRTWRSDLKGPARGRLFEQTLYGEWEGRRLELDTRAGGRLVRGYRSASGLIHENDGVIVAPDLTVHVEAKHLTDVVPKNEVLVFNQKGLDYFAAEAVDLRRRPFYRVLISGGPVSDEVRSFALLWGIVLVDPDRLPLPVLHWIVGSSLAMPEHLRRSALTLWREVPRFVTPLQDRVRRLSECLSAPGTEIVSRSAIGFMLNAQAVIGEALWQLLDMHDPDWLDANISSGLLSVVAAT
jgi:hypothetical protein